MRAVAARRGHDRRLYRDQSAHDERVDLCKEDVDVDAVAGEAALERAERPLVPVVVGRGVDVVHKVRRVLVDRVVGQVHVQVLERRARRCGLEALGREARESLLEDVAPERLERCDGNVQAQVELESVNQQRVANVL